MPGRELAAVLCAAFITGWAPALAAGTVLTDLETLYPKPDPALGEVLQENEIANARALIEELQRQVRGRYAPGKTLRDAHPKAHGCVTADFDVDANLPPELARGVFKPGAHYEALIRFSNGSPKPAPDIDGDGRGMAIKLYGLRDKKKLFSPPGREDEHDFVLVSSPDFFVDDIGDYLSVFRIYGGDSKLAYAKIPFLLGWRGTNNLRRINATKIPNPLEARYWSTLPYQLGLGREADAVKYSARPCAPGATPYPKNPGPDFLREAMVSTLAAGPACMEFLVQRRGKASLSVENVTREWPEDAAQFERVAKLTIYKQKFDTPEQNQACENESFNPWQALPEHRPLGAVSRVRRVVYQALSEFRHQRNRGDYIALNQGWDDEARGLFYHDPQGSPILPYEWFLALEQPDSDVPFRADEHLESFGLISWKGKWDGADALNPDGLPVGLTKDWNMKGEGGGAWLGMNCAACHVDRIVIEAVRDKRPTSVLIDGGGSHFDFGRFITALRAAMRATADDPSRFQRFAEKVVRRKPTTAESDELLAQLREALALRDQWAERNRMDVTPGPGRVDALNIILNQVTAHMLGRPENARPANAPVSYPFVWNASYLDRVQYNASVSNVGPGAAARNVGQVLGVFGEADLAHEDRGYANSARTHNLIDLEERMQTLTSPRWQELAAIGVLPQLDAAKVERGKTHYAKRCLHCHGIYPAGPRTDLDLATTPVTPIPVVKVRTDPAAAMSFVERTVETGPLEGRMAAYVVGERFCKRAYGDEVLAHAVSGVMIHDLKSAAGLLPGVLGSKASAVAAGFYTGVKDFLGLTETAFIDPETLDLMFRSHIADEADEILDYLEERGLHREPYVPHCTAKPALAPEEVLKERIQKLGVYRARPLNGVWATAPYLHNGSVPTLAAMLKIEERPACFWAGSRDLDSQRVGFKAEVALCPSAPGTGEARAGLLLFDTRVPGNSNQGHFMSEGLMAEQKRDLLEYLKSL